MATAEASVVSHISRLNYGFSFNVPFEPSDEDHKMLGMDRKIWDKAEQRYMVTGKMTWFVNRVTLSVLSKQGPADRLERAQK